jgi:signal transduction histidine kinase
LPFDLAFGKTRGGANRRRRHRLRVLYHREIGKDSKREDGHVPELDKDAFLSTVIHELRAPLNACLMSVNLLELKASQPAEVLRCAEVFKRNLERQARLIQDLADVLQIVAGGIELVTEPVDLGELVDAAAERQRLAADQGGGVEYTRPPGELPVEADVERLARALDALVEYLAAAPGPDRRLTLELAAAEGRARLRLAAVGGAAAGGDSPAVSHKGHGVRLAIAEQVLAAHRGTLQRAGEGFIVELPLQD